MSRLARVRAKMKNDEAMNLTEIALVTGYDRNVLGRMLLPLVEGKMFYTDFRRVLKDRQDRHEHSLAILDPQSKIENRKSKISSVTPPASASPAKDGPLISLADKFRAPKSKRAPRAASRAPVGSPPRSTELQRKRA